MNKDQRRDLAEFIRATPQLTYCAFSDLTTLGYSTITLIAQEFQVRRKTGPKPVVEAPGVK
jgi:hypothetical protein